MDTDTRKDELSFQQRSVVTTLKDNAAFIDGCIDTIERKAHQNFQTINIVAAIVGAVNLGSLTSPGIQTAVTENMANILIYSPTVIVIIIYFVALLKQGEARKMARRKSHPINPQKDAVKWWEGLTVKQYYDETVKDYIKIYKHNNYLNEQKAEQNSVLEHCLRGSILSAFLQLGFCIIAACAL